MFCITLTRAVPRIFCLWGQTPHIPHRGLPYTDRVSSWTLILFSLLHRKLPPRRLEKKNTPMLFVLNCHVTFHGVYVLFSFKQILSLILKHSRCTAVNKGRKSLSFHNSNALYQWSEAFAKTQSLFNCNSSLLSITVTRCIAL